MTRLPAWLKFWKRLPPFLNKVAAGHYVPWYYGYVERLSTHYAIRVAYIPFHIPIRLAMLFWRWLRFAGAQADGMLRSWRKGDQ